MLFKPYFPMVAALAFISFALPPEVRAAANTLPGAISTTVAGCARVNSNIYSSKDDVFVKASASSNGSAFLPNGTYYVRVTDPSGATLLTNPTTTPTVSVTAGGQINGSPCVKLSAVAPYADTPNPGQEYKVAFSSLPDFSNNVTKTDNFKVRTGTAPVGEGQVTVIKFYDANVDGFKNAEEITVTGWQVGYDDQTAFSPASFTGLQLTTYTMFENEPSGNSIRNAYAWVATNAYDESTPLFIGPTAGSHFNQYALDLASGSPRTVYFGNVCVGPNVGGKTLGYWSNKNGQADLIPAMSAYLTSLVNLNLVTSNGTPFDPLDYAQLRAWLLNGNAVNMAYMLSVQLTALNLSVVTGKLKPYTMVYAPNVPDANVAGFISIGNLIVTANGQLAGDGATQYAGYPKRDVQEAIKNAIDDINNNRASVAQLDGANCPALLFP